MPDFETVGFDDTQADALTQAHAALGDVTALSLKACVTASYDPATRKICFKIPIYGQACVKSPVAIPVGGTLKACVQTCGRFVPTGVQASVYLNDNPHPIYSGTVHGRC
ncbi:MAG: hypothetical protein JO306_15155 [Gemmatimonadetes bacterium]|nr:hypothetical protein [Gemmatimonadota bacterium]